MEFQQKNLASARQEQDENSDATFNSFTGKLQEKVLQIHKMHLDVKLVMENYQCILMTAEYSCIVWECHEFG